MRGALVLDLAGGAFAVAAFAVAAFVHLVVWQPGPGCGAPLRMRGACHALTGQIALATFEGFARTGSRRPSDASNVRAVEGSAIMMMGIAAVTPWGALRTWRGW